MTRAISGSSFSAEHYPADAAAYVVAEVYAPLNDGVERLGQKLVQAERVVRFLAAKEGKEAKFYFNSFIINRINYKIISIKIIKTI